MRDKIGMIYLADGDPTFKLLGGPTVIYRREYYTVEYLRVINGLAIGTTHLMTATQIQGYAYIHSEWVGDYSGIVSQDCPSCDNDAMIFYGGDYICAWCREMLEQ